MNLTPEQLEQLQHYASLFMTLSDIAVLLKVDTYELKNAVAVVDSNEYVAYRSGKLETKIKIHEQERELALVGSPLALENMNRNLMTMEDDE